MTHILTIALGDASDLAWAQHTVTAAHYLHAPVDLAGPRSYQTAHITSLIRKGTMLDTNAVIVTTPATAILTGAELRRIVAAEPTAPHAQARRRIGEMDVQLVRDSSKWRLFLADLTPIPHTTRDLWATAVSAPSVEWSQTPDGCSVWCAWREVQP